MAASWMRIAAVSALTLAGVLAPGLPASGPLAAPARAEAPLGEVHVATIAGGTVLWELQTIKDHGFDTANGFDLVIEEVAGNPATQIALQGGAVDAIVTDWIWAARAQDGGLDLRLIPFSTAVGAVLVPADSPAQTLADLSGSKIAVSGSPIDKSWLILRAHAAAAGWDLAEATEQVFAAPPLVLQALESGEVQAMVNNWNFNAKAQAAGARELVSVGEALADLGLDPQAPLLVYAIQRQRADAGLAPALAAASVAAKRLLAEDDTAWEAVRPLMNAATDAEFIALRDGWRAGIPPEGPVDLDAASRFFAVLAEFGGDEVTGGLTALPDGLFHQGD